MAAAGVALFVLALCLRLVYLSQIGGSPQAAILLGDGEAYDLWAKRIAAGDWVGGEAFYQAPLYPYGLALLYALGGPSVVLVRLAQAVLGSLACVLLARAGALTFGTGAGLAAGLLYAAYPVALYHEGLVQKTALEAFLLALLLWLLAELHLREDRPPGFWLASGVTLGLLGLVRENALVLAPLLLAWSWLPPRRWRRPAALALGLALVLLPIGLRNRAVGGSFELTTFQLGTNLYIGNHAGANGLYAPLTPGGGSWRREREDAVRLAEQAEGRPLTPSQVSRYWSGRALAYVRAEPLGWLRLMLRKIVLLVNRVEVGDHDSPQLFAEVSPLLRLLLRGWHFGVLFPLAALGAALAWTRGRRPWLLLGVLGALAASVAAFYVFGRYRFSLVPVLVLFAGAGVAEAVQRLRERSLPARRWALAGLLAAGAALGSNVTVLRSAEIEANAHFNLGWRLEGEGRGDGDPGAALVQYERALAILPAYPDALNNLGNLLARQGRLADAEARFAAALSIDPGHANARLNLGKVLLAEGRPAEAVPPLQTALRQLPGDLLAREQLAKALFAVGRAEEALPHYRELVRLRPSARSHHNLGSALASTGRLREAVLEYEAALRLAPGFAEAHENLALTYLHLGDRRAAEAHRAEAARLRR